MKFVLLFACLISLISAGDDGPFQTIGVQIFEPIESAFEKTHPTKEVEEAFQCLVGVKNEIVGIVNLATSIAEENIIGGAMAAYSVVDNIVGILNNCGVLFCFEPSIKKCESYHSQKCELTGLVVYPKCAEGYTNWDCCVCATECPDDFRDDGLYCAKPGAYGRGAGYAIWHEGKCNSENEQGCEKWGAMWYPKCKPGYHNVGCCICSPDCPEDFTDIGVSCQKPHSYGRGAGYAVSFGTQCLDIHHKKRQENKLKSEEVNCDELKQKIAILKHLVNGKLEAEEHSTHTQGFSHQLQLLTEHVDLYVDVCHPVEQAE